MNKRDLILDTAIALIEKKSEWTISQVASIVDISKSSVLHYFKYKETMMRSIFERYVQAGRRAGSVAVDLTMWIAMREDRSLAKMIRDERLKERESLQIEFDGHLEAWLAQAVRVGLGVMREAGSEADDKEVMKIFRELVFANHVRNRSPEFRNGVEKELSA